MVHKVLKLLQQKPQQYAQQCGAIKTVEFS